jgi:adenylate cyclase
MARIGWPNEVRRGLGWLSSRRSLLQVIRATREVLPGDPSFGDPMSTTGSEPARVLARRAWSAGAGRWGAISELGLAVLQVADWVGGDLRAGGARDSEMAILFTDLVGFSSWALQVGDEDSLEALRQIDAAVTAIVTDHEGEVVKRLGDGAMAVFADAGSALVAAEACIEEVPAVRCDGYEPRIRAGLHYGAPQPIGIDYLGVDVNIAARLCEAAQPDEVLISGAVRSHLHRRKELSRPPRRELDGVPEGLEIYSVGGTRSTIRSTQA